jgi:peroxiredoxin
VNLAVLPGLTVVYAYPMTARPGTEQPRGWDAIPGARGCTAEACAFRDHQSELRAAGVDHLFGLSSQSSAYQREAASRLHLPFALLSDSEFALADAWRLPTFEVGTQRLLKRLTLVLRNGCVEKVFYPVFPPDEHAEQVLRYVSVA